MPSPSFLAATTRTIINSTLARRPVNRGGGVFCCARTSRIARVEAPAARAVRGVAAAVFASARVPATIIIVGAVVDVMALVLVKHGHRLCLRLVRFLVRFQVRFLVRFRGGSRSVRVLGGGRNGSGRGTTWSSLHSVKADDRSDYRAGQHMCALVVKGATYSSTHYQVL